MQEIKDSDRVWTYRALNEYWVLTVSSIQCIKTFKNYKKYYTGSHFLLHSIALPIVPKIK